MINWSNEHVTISSSTGMGGLKRVIIEHVSTGLIGEATGLDYYKTKVKAFDDLGQKLTKYNSNNALVTPSVPLEKTAEDVNQLVAQWKTDPTWDLETTPGFERYAEFLKTVQNEFLEEEAKKAKIKEAELRNRWFTMAINDSFRLDDWTIVRRVPNGWVLTTEAIHGDAAIAIATTFIPSESPRRTIYQD